MAAKTKPRTEMRALHTLKSGDRVLQLDGISTVLSSAPYRTLRVVTLRNSNGKRIQIQSHFNEVVEVVVD
jgi:hypothetical protein